MLTSDSSYPPVLCIDCGLPYEEHGLDTALPDGQWATLFPEESGILCGTCIARRAESLPGAIAIRAYIEFASDQTISWERVTKAGVVVRRMQ